MARRGACCMRAPAAHGEGRLKPASSLRARSISVVAARLAGCGVLPRPLALDSRLGAALLAIRNDWLPHRRAPLEDGADAGATVGRHWDPSPARRPDLIICIGASAPPAVARRWGLVPPPSRTRRTDTRGRRLAQADLKQSDKRRPLRRRRLPTHPPAPPLLQRTGSVMVRRSTRTRPRHAGQSSNRAARASRQLTASDRQLFEAAGNSSSLPYACEFVSARAAGRGSILSNLNRKSRLNLFCNGEYRCTQMCGKYNSCHSQRKSW